MRIRTRPAYSFDDVLLLPQHSELHSRSDVNLSTKLGRMHLTLPLVSANMDSVTEYKMAVAMHKAGGVGILHRFASPEAQRYWLTECDNHKAPAIISVGVGPEAMAVLDANGYLIDAVCVDVAHGDHSRVLDVIRRIREKHADNLDIIAGNVATGAGAARLVEAGANIIKVGIGPGSVCSTRVVSGHGFPQLSAIEEVVQTLQLAGRQDDVSIIADGGIRYPGDIVKALAVGADAVMLGSLLAGTDEAAGERIVEHGVAYKTYRGMASREAQKEKRNGKAPRVEGISTKVPYRGPVSDTLDNLEAGIRSGFSYSGARNLTELVNVAEFVVVTGNTLKENHPHHPYKL